MTPRAYRPSQRRNARTRIVPSVGIPQDFTLTMESPRGAKQKSEAITGTSQQSNADVQDLPIDYAARPRSWLMFGFYSLSRVLAGLHGEDQFYDRLWAARQLLFRAIEARNREIVSRFYSSNPHA